MGAFIFLGVLFLIVGIIYITVKVPQSTAQIKCRTGKADGIVSGVTKRLRRRGTTQRYAYDLSYTVDGEPYEIKRVVTDRKYDQGDELAISYNPDKPGDAHAYEFHLDPKTARKVSYIFLISGAVSLLIGIIMLIAK